MGKLKPNPLFVQNGIDDNGSPECEKDKKYRSIKKIASVGFTAAGHVGSTHTAGINVASQVKHGAALASTAVHLYQFKKMADRVKDGGSLARMLQTILVLKGGKAALRGVKFATGFIPGAGLVSDAVETAHTAIDHATDKAESVMKGIGKMGFLERLAQALHWQAYREAVLTRATGGTDIATSGGPAMNIIRELLGMKITRLPDYLHKPKHVYAVIMEPAGWTVILAKLQQL